MVKPQAAPKEPQACDWTVVASFFACFISSVMTKGAEALVVVAFRVIELDFFLLGQSPLVQIV